MDSRRSRVRYDDVYDVRQDHDRPRHDPRSDRGHGDAYSRDKWDDDRRRPPYGRRDERGSRGEAERHDDRRYNERSRDHPPPQRSGYREDRDRHDRPNDDRNDWHRRPRDNRDWDRRPRDHGDRWSARRDAHDDREERSRYRERSPPARPPASHDRSRWDQREVTQLERSDARPPRDEPAKSEPAKSEPAEPVADEMDADQIASMMGFGNFGSSKVGLVLTQGKHVEDNSEGFAEVRKERSWRQYMNRYVQWLTAGKAGSIVPWTRCNVSHHCRLQSVHVGCQLLQFSIICRFVGEMGGRIGGRKGRRCGGTLHGRFWRRRGWNGVLGLGQRLGKRRGSRRRRSRQPQLL